jgi:hypothetical protein
MRYFILLVLLALCFASCKKDEVNAKQTTSVTSVESIVTGVNGPTKGAVNQNLTYTLLWPNANSQSYFHHINAIVMPDSSRLIKLFVTADTTAIDKANRSSSATFTFKAYKPGTYYLKFAKPGSDTTFSIVDTVMISK